MRMDTRLAWVMFLLLGLTYLHGQARGLTGLVDALQKQHLDEELDPAIAMLRRMKIGADGDVPGALFHPDVRHEVRTQLRDAHRDLEQGVARVNATMQHGAHKEF